MYPQRCVSPNSPDQASADTDSKNKKAWLVRLDGPLTGTRYLIRGALCVGRDPSNDLVLEGEGAEIVSTRHLEITKQGDLYRLCDLNSTNGTYVDGKRVPEMTLHDKALVMLGPNGPRFQFEYDRLPPSNLSKTVMVPEAHMAAEPTPITATSNTAAFAGASFDKQQEKLLKEAVTRARQARRTGFAGQTAVIMREMLGSAIRRSSKKFKIAIGVLLLALISVTTYAAWTIRNLKQQKTYIDTQINEIEKRLQAAGNDPSQMDRLIDELDQYQDQARQMQKNLLYRLGVRSEEQDFIEAEIKTLMKEFGAEEYSLPPEFSEQVRRFVRWYQGPERPHLTRVLSRSRKDLETVRQQLQQEVLPPDLAYMVLVESAFITGTSSSAGAAGLWQFTPATARAYGLKVTATLDERLDPRKSTQAAARYLRELILDFGSGSSVMLSLAAYNLGPGKVKRAVRKVEDPIKQRNFWYLYRVRALPEETRVYVPKIIAAIIIGRNQARFGF